MVGERKETTVRRARSALGTLLVAWTFVSGSAIVIATAHYQRSGDITVLIVWLAPPFVVGTVLFALVGIVSMFGGVKERPVEVSLARGTRHSIFRER